MTIHPQAWQPLIMNRHNLKVNKSLPPIAKHDPFFRPAAPGPNRPTASKRCRITSVHMQCGAHFPGVEHLKFLARPTPLASWRLQRNGNGGRLQAEGESSYCEVDSTDFTRD